MSLWLLFTFCQNLLSYFHHRCGDLLTHFYETLTNGGGQVQMSLLMLLWVTVVFFESQGFHIIFTVCTVLAAQLKHSHSLNGHPVQCNRKKTFCTVAYMFLWHNRDRHWKHHRVALKTLLLSSYYLPQRDFATTPSVDLQSLIASILTPETTLHQLFHIAYYTE